MRSETVYQIILIILGAVAVALLSLFLYREIFPEYKIYQERYIELEKFRSSYTHEPPAPFATGIKQIVRFLPTNGPPNIDRCTSCHVALQVEAYSPTKIGRDVNGEVLLSIEGVPVKVPNENYVWRKLDEKIENLSDPQEIKKLEELRTVEVGERSYDVTKVLAMHPLIGKETRPFEFHPLEEYGCVVCHNGDGHSLTTEKAHGPLFDGQYEIEFRGPKPTFLETDPKNDPPFARMFNDKPGEKLLFQTHPLFTGDLIQAQCVQCHLSSPEAVKASLEPASIVTKRRKNHANAIKRAFESEKNNLVSLVLLRNEGQERGFSAVVDYLKKQASDYTLPILEADQVASQYKFLSQLMESNSSIQEQLQIAIKGIVGNQELVQQQIDQITSTKKEEVRQEIDALIKRYQQDPQITGSIFAKAAAWDLEQELMKHVIDTESSLSETINDQQFMNAVSSDIDQLLGDYKNGRDLYISQACYACHRITGMARGGIGPELTFIGNYYPWYIKSKMVWPQGDLPTSTMPNYHLDHEELESLMTFLLGQQGPNRTMAGTTYKIAMQEWEAGKKSELEKPIAASQIRNLDYGMTVFATEGCSACHRLEGFESNVGFKIEKSSPSFEQLYQEKIWFESLFPEAIKGSEIVHTVDQYKAEIDARIVDDVRQDALIERIEKNHPGHIEALYGNFKFASRAKDFHFKQKIDQEKDPQQKAVLNAEWQEWKARIKRILKIYIQEYGLGRLIGPRPNWSGVNRSDEWLLEHFRNPGGHVPRSIMPAFPFDDTKFYSLIYMLNQLAIRNTDALHAIWRHDGFHPEMAAHILCAQCHGELLIGNGVVAQWIYPIPKNLRDPVFLRNLTKEQAIESITHGVKGTPMPPWGEVGSDKQNHASLKPVLSQEEIHLLVNWLFASVPGGEVIRGAQDVPKWHYDVEDVITEMRQEGHGLADVKTVQDLFTIEANPNKSSPEPSLFYIKEKFYTPENLEKGEQFFDVNCAICHGTEAEGSGLRAEVMTESKPRMLTNLDWLNTRDDLRLIRSIKFGVPGTAMTPWGDFTSSLQRIQLAIFIRSLSTEKEERDQLTAAIYQAFEKPQIHLATSNQPTLLQTLKKEQAIFQEIGNTLLAKRTDSATFSLFIKLINAYQQKYSINEQGQLTVNPLSPEFQQLKSQFIAYLNTQISKQDSDSPSYIRLLRLLGDLEGS